MTTSEKKTMTWIQLTLLKAFMIRTKMGRTWTKNNEDSTNNNNKTNINKFNNTLEKKQYRIAKLTTTTNTIERQSNKVADICKNKSTRKSRQIIDIKKVEQHQQQHQYWLNNNNNKEQKKSMVTFIAKTTKRN